MDENERESQVNNNLELDPVRTEVVSASKRQRLPSENSLLLQPTMRFSLNYCKSAFSDRSALVDILGIFFGIASWIGVNSTYLQLPLLVKTAPENWSLPSYLGVIVQLGNIGPIFYTVIQKVFPNRMKDAYMIYAVLAIGTVAAVFMAVFHQETAFIAGNDHSVALFIIVFFFALVGCTSSVLFMPYMGRFREKYLVTYLIGEGMSGFVPSIATLIQGVGGNAECIPSNATESGKILYQAPPRFETKAFFFFIFGIFILSSVAFTFLDQLKSVKKEYAAVTIKHGNDYTYDTEKRDEVEKKSAKTLSVLNYNFLFILMAIVCMFGNGVFPSLQSYSCLPYGNVAYHLTVTLSSIANPLACFLAVFVPHTSIRWIWGICGVTSLVAIYTISTALLSPTPPLVGTPFGSFLIVICWTLLNGFVSYIKLSIIAVFRFQGGKALVWIGAVQQLGSVIGSVITFCLVQFTILFTSYQVEC